MTYEVKFSHINIHVSGDVPPSQWFYVLNCAVVALCVDSNKHEIVNEVKAAESF